MVRRLHQAATSQLSAPPAPAPAPQCAGRASAAAGAARLPRAHARGTTQARLHTRHALARAAPRASVPACLAPGLNSHIAQGASVPACLAQGLNSRVDPRASVPACLAQGLNSRVARKVSVPACLGQSLNAHPEQRAHARPPRHCHSRCHPTAISQPPLQRHCCRRHRCGRKRLGLRCGRPRCPCLVPHTFQTARRAPTVAGRRSLAHPRASPRLTMHRAARRAVRPHRARHPSLRLRGGPRPRWRPPPGGRVGRAHAAAAAAAARSP
eukprot:350796-Chlamydomonas_euryale.AAC.11